ncbi:metallo-beta-lactamase family protein-like protein [Strigomonas culicis]|nr:metallo-beta-lactamase family protein-like protein [Strigomonas culicis]|eukprot:EPY33292.1 metallo-beta-lactamase family protein-like protein [Strigomonas culicis]
MWCPAEQCWIDAFPRACERYQRHEEKLQPLPFAQNDLYSYYTYAHQLQEQQRAAERQQAVALARARRGRGAAHKYDDAYLEAEQEEAPLPPQLVRQQDVLLSCATNRSTSFHDFGHHSVLHYIFTPGHSPGHMMLSLPREKLLFTGDVLFYNGIGRVDLPWATGEKLAESLLMLESHPDNTVLLPGHGRLSTLGRERRHNAALRSLYARKQMGLQEISVGFNEGYL